MRRVVLCVWLLSAIEAAAGCGHADPAPSADKRTPEKIAEDEARAHRGTSDIVAAREEAALERRRRLDPGPIETGCRIRRDGKRFQYGFLTQAALDRWEKTSERGPQAIALRDGGACVRIAGDNLSRLSRVRLLDGENAGKEVWTLSVWVGP
jgi:hypothetical protein